MHQVPLMDCRRQYAELRAEHEAAVMRVLQSGWYLQGSEVQAFENAFAEYCGIKHCVGVGNGTDALELALRAVGCGPGCEVVMAANAGMYASAATLLVGATPVFADVDPHTLLISPESIERMLSHHTRGIVATHLYGGLCDIAGIRAIIGNRPISLIEDCAQAHGARNAAGRAGCFGDIGTFSFYPTKNLGAIGDGGAVVTDDSTLAQAVRELAQYGWSRRYFATRDLGRNSRLDEIQAAVLNVRLPHLDRWNERRREIVRRYRLAATGTRLVFVSAPVPENVCHLCVARHPDRDRVRKVFEDQGIATSVHYPLLDVEQQALSGVGYRADDLTESGKAKGEILTLPCFPQMTEAEIERVSQVIRSLD